MNIAIFASAFWPHVGGVEELCRQLAHAYQAAGHGAIIITNQWPPALPEAEDYEGIPVYRLPMRTPEGKLKERVKYTITHGGVRRRMLAILRRRSINLLHVQCVSCNGHYALLARRELRLPLVVTAQGERTMDAGRLYERSAFANQTLRELLIEADHITACSADTLADIERFLATPFGVRASVIHNGIRLADFEGAVPHRHARPYILGIGRLVPQKGFDVLIRAFHKSNVASHDLLIAGEGPEREALRRLIEELGVGERVRLVGRADRALAVSLFKGCSFFVLPSRMEPQGIVILEAMAAGKAVIASRVGGVPEIVTDRQTGLLVKPDDVAELSTALHSLCASSQLCERLGASGQNLAKGFDWPRVADQYMAIYRHIVSPPEKVGSNLTTAYS